MSDYLTAEQYEYARKTGDWESGKVLTHGQALNDNQKIVLEWLKSNEYSLKLPTLAINQLDRTTDMKVREAHWKLNRKQEFEVLLAFAQWGLEQEEA
ncbi:hypothetical protein ACG6R3_002795 [Enterococcus faecium]